MKVTITKDISIAFNGIDVEDFAKGEEVELAEGKCQRLMELKAAEAYKQAVVEKPATKSKKGK